MAEWRLAKSLDVLRDEIESKYPGTTIWSIGDQAHQSGYSDHNPTSKGVVCAIDVRGNAGLSLPAFVKHLITNPHPNLRYVIHARKIYERKNGFAAREYNGSNAHAEHAHVSVGNGPDGRSTSGYDNTSTWGIADIGEHSEPVKPSKPSTETSHKLGDKMPTLQRGSKGTDVRRLQALLVANGYKVSIDGIFGSQTEKVLKSYQAKHARPADAIAGKVTWNALLGV
jgi:hypothetical protein